MSDNISHFPNKKKTKEAEVFHFRHGCNDDHWGYNWMIQSIDGELMCFCTSCGDGISFKEVVEVMEKSQ